jgi:hypothetical protein
MVLQRNCLVLAGWLIISLGILVMPVSAAYHGLDPGDPVPAPFNSAGYGNPVITMPESAAFDGIGPGESLQAAIDAANDGDTIYLDPGTYNEHGITISKNIILMANESAGGNRDNTIIDAQRLDHIFHVTGAFALTIDNLTLQNGTISGRGGAIYAPLGGTLTITSSSFSNFSATGGGGAIYTLYTTTTITSSSFSHCSTTGDAEDESGGAIYSNYGSLTIISSTFSDCTATTNGVFGGAVEAFSSLTITSSTFTDCSANDGGAIDIYSDATITSSTFINCAATGAVAQGYGNGGAIWFMGSGPVVITSSVFSGCSATDSGGAFYDRYDPSTVIITSSTFSDSSSGGDGGAIYIDESTLTVDSSSFTGCLASGNGGAISTYSGSFAIASSTFSGCTATQSGGAIDNYGGTMMVTSSIFTGNSAADGSAIDSQSSGSSVHFSQFYQNTAPGNDVIHSPTNEFDARNNWWGTNDGYSGMILGSYVADPWLVLGITADPPAVNTAQPSIIRTNLTFDSTAGDTSSTGFFVPDGITTTFAVTSGSGSVSPGTDGTINGVAQTTFTPMYGESVTISGTVDDQPVYITLPVTQGAPALTGITPNTGINTSTVGITNLAGVSFVNTGTTRVVLTRIGHTNITATGVTVVDNTQITGTLPIIGAAAGAWDVVVINPDGQEGVLPHGFRITAPAPGPTPPTPEPTYNQYDTGSSTSDFSPSTFPLMTVTVNIGGDSKAWQAIVTGTKLSELIVTGTVRHDSGSNLTAPPGIVYQYISLVPARYSTISSAVINFTVPQSWLDENHIPPGSIVMYHQTANGWDALPTTLLYTKDGTVFFSAQSAGLSLFAIAGIPVVTTPGPVTTPGTLSSQAQEQAPVPVSKTHEPFTTQTTAPPAAAAQPAAPSPLMVIILLIAVAGVLGAGGFFVRRWWIRRQNPALFED